MQHWAKRGLQTALVTGGLLMLGTGIAAADENVDPDAAPSPLDGGVSVPVKVGNVTLGTPMGEKHVGMLVDQEVETGHLLKKVGHRAAPYAKGNVVAPNVLVPAEVSGFAIAAGGDAHNVNNSTETHAQGHGVETSGKEEGLAGNVVAPTAVVPAQVTGIAFPALGSATVDNTTDQDSTAGGSITTDGERGSGSGNIVAPHAAIPVGVNNTAAAGAGVAKVFGDSTQTATAPGSRQTNGDDAVLSGNLASAPIAFPAHVDGTAASLGGIAATDASNTVSAAAGTAGSDRDDHGYAGTGGRDSVLSGNAATPQVAPLATVDCTAGTLGGKSSTLCENDSMTEAGGDVASSGEQSVLGGNVADVPLATPATVNHTAGAMGGKADALPSVSNTEALAGGTASTGGHKSVLGGNVAGAPASTPASADCTAGALGGMVSSTCDDIVTSEAGNAPEMADYASTDGDMSTGGGNVVTAQPNPFAAVDCTSGVWGGMSATDCATDGVSEAGGGTSSTGDESTVGGNIVDANAAVPAEVYSNAAAWVGNSSATGSKSMLADAGGMADTSGENSTIGGNTVRPKLAVPAAADCNAPVWGGSSTTACSTASEAEAGGDTHSNGDDSVIGGNNVEAPVSPVTSASTIAASWVGMSEAVQTNSTRSEAGGYTFSQGDGSVAGGNQVLSPVASAQDATCIAGAAAGMADCVGTNDVDTKAGGYNGTTGNDSSVAGNVVTVPQAPVGEGFGIAGAAAGHSSSNYSEDKDVTSGGPSQTNDDRGNISSNIVAVPGAPAAQVSNLAAGAVAQPTSVVEKDTDNTAGGDIGASANDSTLSGNLVQAPYALPADVHTLAASGVGHALAEGEHETESAAGGDSDTTAIGSPASGNIVGSPFAGAANVYGMTAGAVSTNEATSDKELSSLAGGDTTSDGTAGSLAGNQVLADGNAVAGVFGNAFSAVGNDKNDSVATHEVGSGGNATSAGDNGSLTGNVVNADAQPLAQVFGLNAAGGGSTLNTVDQTTDAANGGTVDTSGVGGNFAGNLLDADAQAPWQVFGVEAGALGAPVNSVLHDTTVANSGTNTTAGDGGNLAGNVVNGDAQWPAQVFGMDASAAGDSVNTVSNTLSATNGSSTDTSGVAGNGSGNVVAAQAQTVPQVLGYGVAALGTASQGTISDTAASNGGDNTTAGTAGQLSGFIVDPVASANPGTFAWAASAFGDVTNMTDNQLSASNGGTDTAVDGEVLQLPIGLAPQVNEVLVPVGGQITNVFSNSSTSMVADADAMNLDAADGLMQAAAVPSLPAFSELPSVPELPELPAVPGGMGRSDVPSLPGLDLLDGLGLDLLQDTVMLPAIDQTQTIPAVPAFDDFGGLGDFGGLPMAGDFGGVPSLPAVPAVPQFGGLPVGMPMERDLPTTEFSRVPGVSDGVESFQSNLRTPIPAADFPMPGAGSLSGQLPLGDVASLSQTPAMPGLDSAPLGGLFGELHSR